MEILGFKLCKIFLKQPEYYTDRFVSISDDYSACLISKCGCSTVTVQGICYKNGDDISKFHLFENNHLLDAGIDDNNVYIYRTDPFSLTEKLSSNNTNRKNIAIFRDPVDRFISIMHTKHMNLFGNSLDNLLDFVEKVSNNGEFYKLDQHFVPQCMFYTLNSIDVFVELKDYGNFCKLNNIPWQLVNKNNDDSYKNFKLTEKQISRIKELYYCDSVLIDNIKSSGRLWNY